VPSIIPSFRLSQPVIFCERKRKRRSRIDNEVHCKIHCFVVPQAKAIVKGGGHTGGRAQAGVDSTQLV